MSGFRQFEDGYKFLSDSGALNYDQLDPNTTVTFTGRNQLYSIPPPPPTESRREYLKVRVRKVLQILNLSKIKPEIDVLMISSVFRAPTFSLWPIAYTTILLAESGSYKSTISTLLLSFFGKFNVYSMEMPLSWADTLHSLRTLLHEVGDVIIVIDDGANGTDKKITADYHGKMFEIVKAVGNNQARNACNTDGSVKDTLPHRCMVFSSNENPPKDKGVLTRSLIVEWRKKDANEAELDELRRYSFDGVINEFMACYIGYLSNQMGQLKKDLPNIYTNFLTRAAEFGVRGGHGRETGIFANLMMGKDFFLSFCEDEKILSDTEIGEINEFMTLNIVKIVNIQPVHQETNDEVLRFLEYLKTGLTTGLCHLADCITQQRPELCPHTYGYQNQGKDFEGKTIYVGSGELVGWVNQSKGKIFLLMSMAFPVVQTLARRSGNELQITEIDLVKKLGEREIALDSITKKGAYVYYTVSRKIAGSNQQVVTISDKWVRNTDFAEKPE